jgi:hypothetical protein
MKIKTTLVLAALVMAGASPAFAKASIQKGTNVCKAAIAGQTPAPTSSRLDGDQTRVSNDEIVFVFKTQNADKSSAKVTCTVNRDTSEAKLSTAPN